MSDDVKSKIKKIVADHLGIDEEKVQKMNPREVLTMLKYPAKIKKD